MLIFKIKDFINIFILGILILIFDHIDRRSFFGFVYPWIEIILISFVIYLAITMPYFHKKLKGAKVLLIGILFIFFQYFLTTAETFKASLVFISFIVITTIIIKNTSPKKTKFFLKIILLCCFLNLLYAYYLVLSSKVILSGSFRLSGFDQNPVLFGYNMLLGFWLSVINPIIRRNSDKQNSKIDNLLSLFFIVAILLSQSVGALLGLITGIMAIIIYNKKISKSKILKSILISIFIFLLILIFPTFFWESFGFGRINGKIVSLFSEKKGMKDFYYGIINLLFILMNLIF